MARPNVLWITIDSVRSDHTSLDGYHRATTPELQSLADTGYGFRDCIAHGRATLPSSGAILTGQTPSRTTVGITGDVLPRSVRTIAERFAAAGYRTAALSGNSFVGDETELNRGFDTYQWLTSSTLRELGPVVLIKYLRNIRRHSAGLTLDASKHSSPYLMNAIAKRWLPELEADERPFFYYLHYNEPHRPYYPPLSYRDRFTDEIDQGPREAAETALRIHRNVNEIIAAGCDLPKSDWEALTAMYDAEIAYTDRMVGELIQWVDRQDIGETICVLTADHGELLGEYGLLSHKFVLHDEVTRVPLVLTGLRESLIPDNSDLVQHADVMRTLLEIAGADTDGLVGHDLRLSKPEFAISQGGSQDFEQILQHNPDWDQDRFHHGLLTALRTEDWRYHRSDSGAELFDLPNSQKDVRADHPDMAVALEDKLEQWLEEHGTPVADSREGNFSEATKRQLRELGYID